MRRVIKIPFPLAPFDLALPPEAEIVHVASHERWPCMWVMMPDGAEWEMAKGSSFLPVFDEERVHPDWSYVGTCRDVRHASTGQLITVHLFRLESK